VPKTTQPWVATLVRTVFDQPDVDAVRAQFDRVVAAIAEKFPAAADHLDEARGDLLAFTAFPREICLHRGVAVDPRSGWLVRGGIPQPHCAVQTGGGQQPPVGAECDREDAAVLANPARRRSGAVSRRVGGTESGGSLSARQGNSE